MPAPSREDLDKAIDKTAEDLVRLANEGGAFVSVTSGGTTAAVSAAAACMSADALTLSALLAYRASPGGDAPLRRIPLNPDARGRTPEQMIADVVADAAKKIGGAS